MTSTLSRFVQPDSLQIPRVPALKSIGSLVCVLALTIAACDDPSNVGLGLIGDQGGVPIQRSLESTDVHTQHFRYITGGIVGIFGEEVTAMLVGMVDDPQFGRTVVHGHASVEQAPFLPVDFRDKPVTAARILMRRNYLYGDSTSTVQVRLREVTAPWEASGAHADTSLSIGDEITTFEFSPNDTLVTVPMPDAWVEAQNALLRETAEAFQNNFHGFQFEPLSGNAVTGFSPSVFDLQVINETDTTVFPGVKVFSQIANDGNLNLPPEVQPLQAGVGLTLGVNFDIGSIGGLSALNRIELHVQPDSAAWAAGVHETFHRPFPMRLSLFAETLNRGEVLLHTVDYDAANRRYSFSAETFDRVMRDVLIGKDELLRFLLRLPPAPLTVNSLLIHDEADPERAPRLTITAVPVD